MELFLIAVLSSGLSLFLSCGHMNVKLDVLVSQLLKHQRHLTVELLSLITYEHVFYVLTTFFWW
jgi:hypothetical protein